MSVRKFVIVGTVELVQDLVQELVHVEKQNLTFPVQRIFLLVVIHVERCWIVENMHVYSAVIRAHVEIVDRWLLRRVDVERNRKKFNVVKIIFVISNVTI